jgi:hypothetical protein
VVEFEMEVHNRGNGDDDYELEVANSEELQNHGWSVELDKSVLEGVEPRSMKTVKITVYSPQRFTLWKQQMTEIIINVVSESGREGSGYEGLGQKDFSFFVYERGTYIPIELAACTIISIVVIVTVSVWYRRRSYRKWKESKEAEDEDEDSEDEEEDK